MRALSHVIEMSNCDCYVCAVAVTVVLVPGGHVMTIAFAIGLSIQELKRPLAAEFRVPAEVLQISVDGTGDSCFSLTLVFFFVMADLIDHCQEIKHTCCHLTSFTDAPVHVSEQGWPFRC